MQNYSNADVDESIQQVTTPSTIEQERFLSLIEFAQQSARLKLNPIKDVSKHGIFQRFEHELIALPGVHFDTSENDQDEVWLRIERLTETSPPIPEDDRLIVRLDISNKAETEPH